MRGEAFLVVKAYEEQIAKAAQEQQPICARESGLPSVQPADFAGVPSAATMQVPHFVPHTSRPRFPAPATDDLKFLARGGLSRWMDDAPIRVIGIDIQTEAGSTDTLVCLSPARLVLRLVVEKEDDYVCCYGIAIHDHMGACAARIYSSPDAFHGRKGDQREVSLVLNPCQIGPGEYTFGISVTEHTGIERINHGRRFDLLSRSFALRVVMPDSLGAASAAFLHSAEWSFERRTA